MTIARLLVIAAVALGGGCRFDLPDEVSSPPNSDLQLGCSIDCHGDDTSNAPPKSVSGATATTSVAVGAHRVHLNVEPTWHRQVQCAACHVVPAEVDSPGHLDGDGKAEVTFAMIAGPSATWNGTTCMASCHGSAAMGGAQPTPTWTKVDGAQVTCGSCHGLPPPAPHPNDTSCAKCHPTMEEGSMTFRDPDNHIDGILEVVDPAATGGCTTCHGSATSSAPPKDLTGGSSPTTRGTGAHAAHLAPSNWHLAVTCRSCHTVPLTVDAPGHRDGDNVAEVIFTNTNLNRTATYSFGTATCATLYCHGNGRGNNGTASWITPGALACNSCHSTNGTGMSGSHARHLDRGLKCSQCHQTVIDANLDFVNATFHVNGVHEVKLQTGTWDPGARRCSNTDCHGTRSWL